MKVELKATDNVGVTTTFTIDNSLNSEEDFATFFVQLFLFLERAGANTAIIPDDILDQIDEYYEDRK